MPDQAEHLRYLFHSAPSIARGPQGGAPLIVVMGCRAEVGATTVALNLGVVLGNRGARVLVVDATDRRSNMMEIAGARSQGAITLPGVSAGNANLTDALVPGPNGIQLCSARGCSSAARKAATGTSSAKQARGPSSPRPNGSRKAGSPEDNELAATLKSLRGQFDLIVVDAGAGLSRVSKRLWLRAELALLIATADDAAVMDAYAAIKRHLLGTKDATCENVRVLINQVESDRMAEDAQRRLANCCQRFLRQNVTALPALPRWNREDAVMSAHPRVWESPNSEFGHAVLWLGRAVGDLLHMADSRDADAEARSFAFPNIQHPASTIQHPTKRYQFAQHVNQIN